MTRVPARHGDASKPTDDVRRVYRVQVSYSLIRRFRVKRLGIVLAGAGARGAYEAGALSVLLPALEAEGQRPTIFVGTSAGAINAAGFASLIEHGAVEASRRVLALWRAIDARSVFRPLPLGLATTALDALRNVASIAGGDPARFPLGVLDTAPLLGSVEALLPWDQIALNLADDRVLHAVGLAATAEADHRTRVFVARSKSSALPAPDERRGIDYRDVTLSAVHAVASSAIPIVFPAVTIDDPVDGPSWYADGGVRLNTPIKPALELGADRIVVVATSPMRLDPITRATALGPAPGLSSGIAEVLHAMLTDGMVQDINTLHDRNGQADASQGRITRIPYVFAGPAQPGGFAALTREVLRQHGRLGASRLARLRALPGRALATNRDRCEILSFLMFDPVFIDRAIELGRADAKRCLDADGKVKWSDDR
jgi:NTE family protein